MKKIVSIVLALTMALSLCVTTTWAVDADTTWYNDTDSVFTLTDAADLLGLATLVNGGNIFKGKTVKLGADIDLGGMTWTPIGTDTVSFQGEFDGQGKTIKKFTLDASVDGARVGFFKHLDVSTQDQTEHQKVHDLTLSDVTATVGQNARFGTLAYSVNGEYYSLNAKVENVYVRDVTVTVANGNGDTFVGGFCGWVDTGVKMNNCAVSNLKVTTGNNGAGMIAGFAPVMNVTYHSGANAYLSFTNCDVNGFTVIASSGTTDCNIGGFGMQTQTNEKKFSFNGCDVTGLDVKASGKAHVGGFIVAPGGVTTTENCSVQGKIDVTGVTEGYAGGFYGCYGWGVAATQQITGCSINVDITTKDVPAGGLVGDATDSGDKTAAFENCTVAGSVVSSGNGTVGALGGSVDRGTFKNCTVSNTVNGNANGALFGETPESNYDLYAIELNPTAATMAPNDTLTLNATTYPAEGCAVQWESSDDTIATVDANGVVTAVSDGSATITAKLVPAEYPIVDTNGDTNVATQAQPNDGEQTPEQTVYATATCAITVQTPTETPAHSHTRRQPTITTEVAPDTTKTDVVTSAKTFDAGVAVYAAMGILSLTGSAWVVGKKRG